MKEFMMVFVGQEYDVLGLSPEQIQERMGKWFTWSEKMTKQGRAPKGNALHPTGRVIDGPDRVVTDGPLMEGKELLGGYYEFKAKDYADALEVAQDYPDFDLGGKVEIREIMVFE